MAANLLQKCLAELVGTFVLVFAGTGAIMIDEITKGGVTHVGVSLTFGLTVMAMIYATGDISGAHLNPAVTIGFAAAGRFSPRFVAAYVASQMAALLASVTALLILGNRAHLGATLPAFEPGQSFWLEVILTGILMFVILRVSTGSKEVGMMAGIAIGGVIGLEALFAGPISGASMNPARSLAPAIVGGVFNSLWVYLTAPVVGALCAVPVWRLCRVREEIKR